MFEVKLLSRVRLFEIPWTVAYQAPPSTEFSRQEYWSGLPFPSPGDHGVTKSWTRLSNLHFKVEKASLVAQAVKNLPAVQETWVRSLGWEDPLEKGMATHSSILA